MTHESGLETQEHQIQGRRGRVIVSGPPDGLPVLIIHGFGNTPRSANRRTLDSLASVLSQSDVPVRMIAPVLPGFGGTAPLATEPSLAAYASWCAACLQTMGIERRVVVVGESMGGAIAIEFAAAHRDRVAALAVFNSVGAQTGRRSKMQWLLGAALGTSIRRGHLAQWFASAIDVALVLRHPLNAWRTFESVVDADLTHCLDYLNDHDVQVASVFARNDPLIPHASARAFSRRLGVEPTFVDADHRSFIDGHPVIAALVAELVGAIDHERPIDDTIWLSHALAHSPSALDSVRIVSNAGSGLPFVLALHGLGHTIETMMPLANRLTDVAQVMVPEMPGFGHSSRPVHVLDVDEHASILAQWLRDRDVDDVVVVGHSFGAQVAAALASSHPELVRACVLVGPTVDADARTVGHQLVRAALDVLHEPASLLWVATKGYALAGPKTLVNASRYATMDHIEDRLARVGIPVTIVRGSSDVMVPQSWASRLATIAPSTELITIEGAAHVAHWSAPDAVAAVVRETLLRN